METKGGEEEGRRERKGWRESRGGGRVKRRRTREGCEGKMKGEKGKEM